MNQAGILAFNPRPAATRPACPRRMRPVRLPKLTIPDCAETSVSGTLRRAVMEQKVHAVVSRPAGRGPKWLSGLGAGILIFGVLGMLVAGSIIIYQRFNASGPHRRDYQGRVVRKSLTITESQMGAGKVLRLHVRPQSGEEFQVIVNQDLYERVEEGMWITTTPEGARLSWTEPAL